jgi:hypothetical protein
MQTPRKIRGEGNLVTGYGEGLAFLVRASQALVNSFSFREEICGPGWLVMLAQRVGDTPMSDP